MFDPGFTIPSSVLYAPILCTLWLNFARSAFSLGSKPVFLDFILQRSTAHTQIASSLHAISQILSQRSANDTAFSFLRDSLKVFRCRDWASSVSIAEDPEDRLSGKSSGSRIRPVLIITARSTTLES